MSEVDKQMLTEMDGISVLRTFLVEIWAEIESAHPKMPQQDRFRLHFLRSELWEQRQPKQIAEGLYGLGRLCERMRLAGELCIGFYQFALQYDPRHRLAAVSAIRVFSRLGRWSMALKLWRMLSAFGTSHQRAEALFEMGQIYLGFYGSEVGFESCVRSLSSDKIGPLSPDLEVWLLLHTRASTLWCHARYDRIYHWLKDARDGEVRQLFTRFALDEAITHLDVTSMASLLSRPDLASAERLLLIACSLATDASSRPEFGLDVCEFTEREMFSAEALVELFSRVFDCKQSASASYASAWFLGWLLGTQERTEFDMNHGLEIALEDVALAPVIGVLTMLESRAHGPLSGVEERYLKKATDPLTCMRLHKRLWDEQAWIYFRGELERRLDRETTQISKRILQFRLSELDEALGHTDKAMRGFEGLYRSSIQCWMSWAALARLNLATTGVLADDHLDCVPLASIDEHHRRMVEWWIKLEGMVPSASIEFLPSVSLPERLEQELRPILPCSVADVLGKVRASILAPSLRSKQVYIWPSEAEENLGLSVHNYIACGWILDGANVNPRIMETLLEMLPDTQGAFVLGLAMLRQQELEHESLDQLLAAKFPQQTNTFLAASERVVRRRSSPMTVEETGDLGFLLSRRLHPAFGHELVSMRAWIYALRFGAWRESMHIWHNLLDRGVGCLSAELGLLCGLVQSRDDNSAWFLELKSFIQCFNHASLKQACERWLSVRLDESMPVFEGENQPDSFTVFDGMRQSFRKRDAELLSVYVKTLERKGFSPMLVGSFAHHLSRAQEMAGDILSAVRTQTAVDLDARSQASTRWLIQWLYSDGDLGLAEALQATSTNGGEDAELCLELGHIFWEHQQTAQSIRAYTKLLAHEQLRKQTLCELGSRLGEHGRRTEAGQFFLQLVKVSVSPENRQGLLDQALEWFEAEGDFERTVEVLEALYREHLGDYEYVVRAKSLFLRSSQPNELADYLERLRGLSLASSDQISLELVSLYARTLNQVNAAKRVCMELMQRSFHLHDGLLKGLADEMSELGMWSEVVEVYKSLLRRGEVQVDFNSSLPYRLASILQEKVQDYAGARIILEDILAIHPNATEAIERLAHLAIVDGSPPSSVKTALNRAIQAMEPGSPRAELMIKLAHLESTEGKTDRALNLRQAALSDAPDNLSLVGSVVEELVRLGLEKEASATLLKYELLNQGRVKDVTELDRLRDFLQSNTSEPLETSLGADRSEGGRIIVRQVLEQLAEQFDGPEVDWFRMLSQGEPLNQGARLTLSSQVRKTNLSRVLRNPKDRILEVLSWLDTIFAVQPQRDVQSTPMRLSNQERFVGSVMGLKWARLPIHTAFYAQGYLVVSNKLCQVKPAIKDFLIQYFVELTALNGLVFTRWVRSELAAMAEEFCRLRLEGPRPTDKDRLQIRQCLEQTPLKGFQHDVVETVAQNLHVLPNLIEEIVGSALEQTMLATADLSAGFEAMHLLDESIEHYHRGDETLLTELLPRTLLRHQRDYLTKSTKGANVELTF